MQSCLICMISINWLLFLFPFKVWLKSTTLVTAFAPVT